MEQQQEQAIQTIEIHDPNPDIEGKWNIAAVPQKDGSPTVYFVCYGYVEHGMTTDLGKAKVCAEVLAGPDVQVPVITYPAE